MSKRYINVRSSFLQHEADNWLLMISADKVSSDAKIVYVVLKKIQDCRMSCMTDAHSWLKISGLKMDRVKECLAELENFGLIEQYYSTKTAMSNNRTTMPTCYLLNHFLMKDCYQIIDCPHDGHSFKNPQDDENILRNSEVARTIKEFKETALGAKHEKSDKANVVN